MNRYRNRPASAVALAARAFGELLGWATILALAIAFWFLIP